MGNVIESSINIGLIEYKLIGRNIDIGTNNKNKKFRLNMVIWGKFYEVVQHRDGRQISKRHKNHSHQHANGNDIESNRSSINIGSFTTNLRDGI